ncbi:unnamed protein product, partial [Allacma fusca]
MISAIILILVLATGAYYYLNKKKWKLPPGPVGIPGVGNFSMGKSPHIVHSSCRKKYGDIYCLTIGRTRIVVLGNVQFIKDCFNDPNFNGRPAEMLFCILSQGQHGIIASEGQEWTEQRRFTLRHLRDFGFGKNLMENLIMEEVNDFNSCLKSEEGKSLFMNAQKFELPVLNALWMIITGKKFKHDDTEKLGLLKKLDDFVRPSLADGVRSLIAVIGDMFFAGAETSSATLA